MSHTTALGMEVELEHLKMLHDRFADLLKEIEQDHATAVSPAVKVALGSLKEIATAGVNTARSSQEQIRTSSSASQASH
jgi:hypothetical protein